jgi:hypothetical protein
MTYLELRTRTQYLRGEDDVAGDTVLNSHMQYAILDILNKYPFSWAKVVLTTQSTNADLPTDINPKWGISVNDGDVEWTQINPEHSYLYSSGDHVFWITYVSDKFYLNAPDTETINLTYSIIPTALSGDNDVCIVPDGEAVAYLAAAKMYIGDERNIELKQDYEQEAEKRIVSMWTADNMFGPILSEGSALDYNSQITGG